MNEIIKQKLKDLPSKPGVYIMRSADNNILYIGKARSLKNRVRQYFGTIGNKTQKVLIMVSKINNFDYIITNNEIEALVLENNLIKKHKPPYNILLKDDKSYPFIKINIRDKFPKVEVVRKLKQDGARYFGPYMQGISVREIMELISSAFQLRSCAMQLDKVPKNHRPCLNYHIKRCEAPCMGYIDHIEYKEKINEVIKFLQGNDKSIEKLLRDKMVQASIDENFELAMQYRNNLHVLEKLIRKQVTAMPKDYDMDIFAIVSNGIYTIIAMLIVRGGKLLGGDKQIINDASLTLGGALENYLISYYNDSNLVKGDIVINESLENADIITEYLGDIANKKVSVVVPIQGVRKQLIDMAESNARDYLEKCVSEAVRKENMSIGGVLQLQELLSLPQTPYRIECYDISHISGTDKVASMVVFTNGTADKKAYRKFKIKTVEGNNDFACMKETLSRRLAHLEESNFGEKPNLIVVDGGKGQLTYALEALKEANAQIPIISLAEREEEVYKPYISEPFILSKDSYALRMLQRLRDEAHRFAITFHRSERGKRQTDSELLAIDGVGAATVKKLFFVFKTIGNIKNAAYEELSEVKGVSDKVAKAIYDYYHTIAD